MFAEAPKVVGSVDWDILVALALATFHVAFYHLTLGVEIFMFFEPMIAETFSGGTLLDTMVPIVLQSRPLLFCQVTNTRVLAHSNCFFLYSK